MNDSENDVFVPTQCTQDDNFTPLEYSVDEICNCYYNDVKKSLHGKVSQTIQKCQSFCRVVGRDRSDKREYTVELFDPVDDNRIRHVPGCCLRKAKVVPLSFDDAVRSIGEVVRSKDGKEYMMIVGVSKDGGAVRINDIPSSDMLREFEFVGSGAPCGKIVMLKADEAFGLQR